MRVHLLISGLTQGVGFRHNTRRKARLWNVIGFVRNLPDGNVEIEAQGTAEDVERLIHWAHHGPADAIVENVSRKDVNDRIGETSFEVK